MIGVTDSDKAKNQRAEEAVHSIGFIGISFHDIETFKEGVRKGYAKGESDTIGRAVKWLEENVWPFTGVDYTALTESFIDAMNK